MLADASDEKGNHDHAEELDNEQDETGRKYEAVGVVAQIVHDLVRTADREHRRVVVAAASRIAGQKVGRVLVAAAVEQARESLGERTGHVERARVVGVDVLNGVPQIRAVLVLDGRRAEEEHEYGDALDDEEHEYERLVEDEEALVGQPCAAQAERAERHAEYADDEHGRGDALHLAEVDQRADLLDFREAIQIGSAPLEHGRQHEHDEAHGEEDQVDQYDQEAHAEAEAAHFHVSHCWMPTDDGWMCLYCAVANRRIATTSQRFRCFAR